MSASPIETRLEGYARPAPCRNRTGVQIPHISWSRVSPFSKTSDVPSWNKTSGRFWKILQKFVLFFVSPTQTEPPWVKIRLAWCLLQRFYMIERLFWGNTCPRSRRNKWVCTHTFLLHLELIYLFLIFLALSRSVLNAYNRLFLYPFIIRTFPTLQRGQKTKLFLSSSLTTMWYPLIL